MVYSDQVDVKAIRVRLGLTQEQLAHELGVSFKTVNRWERGKSVPSPMARALLGSLAERGRKGVS